MSMQADELIKGTAEGVEKSNFNRKSPVWLEKISSLPFPLLDFISTLSATFLGLVLSEDFSVSNWLAYLPLGCLILAFLLKILTTSRSKDIAEQSVHFIGQELSKKDQAYLANIDEMASLASTLADDLEGQNEDASSSAFEAFWRIVSMTVMHRLGPDHGVRVCLFLADQDPEAIRLNPVRFQASSSPGANSTRVFTPRDETFKKVVRSDLPFVVDSKQVQSYVNESEHDGAGSYGRYGACPVSTSSTLYGILTIDVPKKEDLNDIDMSLLSFYAGILAIILASRKDFLGLDKTMCLELWKNGTNHHERSGNHG